LHIHHPGAAVARQGVVIGVVVDYNPEVGTGVVVRIPNAERTESVAVVAHEARILVALLHIVAGEIQAISHILPIWNQSRHVVVHGQVGVSVDLPSHEAQVPAAIVMGITKVGKVERLG
jgi:hypothetical protein